MSDTTSKTTKLLAVLAGLCMLTVGLAAPTAAASTEGTSDDTTNDDAPTETELRESIGPENVDRFIDTWSQRLLDDRFMDRYMGHDGVPQDILDEGFHEHTKLEKLYLVDQLYDAYEDHGAIQEDLVGLSAEQKEEKLTQFKRNAYLVIFEKDRIDRLTETPEDTPSQPAETQEPTSDLTERIRALENDTLTSLEAGDDLATTAERAALHPDQPANVPERLGAPDAVTEDADAVHQDLEVEDPVALDTGLEAVDPVTDTPETDAVVAPLGETPGEPGPDSEPRELVATVRNVVDAATYTVCAESPSMELTCSEPVPLGTPYPTDVDGDDVPDGTAQFGLSPALENVTGFGAEFSFERTPGSEDPLPGRVFAVFEIPAAFQRFSVGLDAMDETLPDATTAGFTLEDIPAALQGDLQFDIELRTSTDADSMALTFFSKKLTPTDFQGAVPGAGEPEPEDPVVGSFDFAPVPELLVLDGRIRENDDGNREVEFHLDQSAQTVLDASISMQKTDSQQARYLDALVDELPTEVDLSFTTNEVGAAEAHYSGSSRIDTFRFTDKTVPSRAEPGDFTLLDAEVHGIPEDITFTLTKPFQADYSASGQVDDASVTMDTYEDGQLLTRLAGTASEIPENWSVQATPTDTSTLWEYEADSRLGEVGFVLIDRDDTDTEATLTATDLPTSMSLLAGQEAVSFDAGDEAIGKITASFSRDGGDLFALPNDHVVVHKRGDALGAHLQISGLQAFTMDPQDGGEYAVELAPGGQSFDVLADIEDGSTDLLATLHVGALPQEIHVDMTTDTNTFGYDADDRIPVVSAAYEDHDTGTEASVTMESLPETLEVSWTDEAPREVTYNASGALSRIHAEYLEEPGETAFDVEVTSLPAFMRVFVRDDKMAFDARNAHDAPSGSGSIGQIHARLATDAQLLSNTPTEDHAVLTDTGSETRASLRYSGLANATFTSTDDVTDVHIENTAKRVFLVQLETPDAIVDGRIDRVPKTIDLHAENDVIEYTASSTIGEMDVRLEEKGSDDFVSAELTVLPDTLTLDLRPDQRNVHWDASARPLCIGPSPLDEQQLQPACPTPTADIAAKITTGGDTWDIGIGIEGIPNEWKVQFPDDKVRFNAVSGALGSVEATVTNHDVVRTLQGNHLSARVQDNGDMDASLRITDIRLVHYEKTDDGFDARLKAGGGQPFTIDAELDDGQTVANAEITIDPLPTDIHVTQVEDKLTYDADKNFDLNAETEIGHPGGIADADTPPSVRGVSVRDGHGCSGAPGCGDAIKADVFLEGFPTFLEIDPSERTYSIENFKPPATTTICTLWGCFLAPADYLELDVELDDITGQRIALWAKQNDIPSPIDITFGPIEQIDDGTEKRTEVSYDASGAMGLFEAQVRIGTDYADVVGELEITNIPSSVDVTAAFGDDTSSVDIDASDGINRITARAGARAALKDLPAALDADAVIELTDIPANVDLTWGEISGGGQTAPGFDYLASSGGLDITASVGGELFFPGGDATAFATLGVTNMAKEAWATMDGSTLKVRTPQGNIGHIEMHAWAEANYGHNSNSCIPGCSNTLRLEFDTHFNANADIDDMWVELDDVSWMNLELGVVSSVRGNYDSVGLGWDQINIGVNAGASATVVLDTGFGDWDTTLVNIGISFNKDLNVAFRIFDHDRHNWKSWNTGVPCEFALNPDTYHVELDLKPEYRRTSWNDFTLTDDSRHLLIPDPEGAVGVTASRILAVILSPAHSDAWLDLNST